MREEKAGKQARVQVQGASRMQESVSGRCIGQGKGTTQQWDLRCGLVWFGA